MSLSREDGTLLVPVANPETVERLMDTAVDIARGGSMEILVIHVVEVPPQLPLSAGSELLDEERTEERLLEDAVAVAEKSGIPADSRLRYARDVATGIVGGAEEYDADGLLMGWRGRPRRRDIVLGSFIDRVLGEATCDVFVKRIRKQSEDVDSILVPVADGPHNELAVELADTLAGQYDAAVELVHVQHPDASEQTRREAETLLSERASIVETTERVETRVLESDNVAGTVTDETAHHDLALLGTTRDGFLGRKLVGSVAQGVGRAGACPVILTRRGK